MAPYILNKTMLRQIRRTIAIVVLSAFLGSSIQMPAYAQVDPMPFMPKPGTMVPLSPEFAPAYLKGIVVHPEDPFKFDFIIYKGDKPLTESQKKEEYTKLTKYFLASLAIPDDDQWVNLSPYEKGRIIKEDFGKTEMGRDLLAQDYMLKQITASLIYPEDNLGKKFWDKVYTQAQKLFGTTNIPVNTFNKVWILPDNALIYEKGNTAYVLKNHLKVMLEEDYLALNKQTNKQTNPSLSLSGPQNATHTVASQIVREIVLPALEKEVNQGKNFAPLRQVYSGMLLATWFKHMLKQSLLGQIYANKAKVRGVDQDPRTNEAIYRQYLKAYKKGVFNFIKEDMDTYSGQPIPRKYFSGGTRSYDWNKEVKITYNEAMGSVAERTAMPYLDFATIAVNAARFDAAMQIEMRDKVELAKARPLADEKIKFGGNVDNSMLAERRDRLIKEALLPVMDLKELPANVIVTSGTDWVTFDHKEINPFTRGEVHFRYKIEITEKPIINTPKIVSLDQENTMEIPSPDIEPWNEDLMQSIRYGLRRMMLADPLNGRFSGKYMDDPYQMEAIKKVGEKFENENKTLVVMATATGKTVVSFRSMDAYLDKIKAGDQKPGAVLFIVNNNTILSEAEEKLRGMYPGKYKTSQVYEGKFDISGDIIFATPGSLSSSNRIEELLKQRNISMVIFDEVHHVPAEQMSTLYRRIEEESIRRKTNTKFLGMTATEIRPDRLSVLNLFKRSIVFEYSIFDGQQEGSLVPVSYFNIDAGYPSEPGNLDPILAGDPRWEKFKEWRYSRSRYGEILSAYQEHSVGLLDKRALTLVNSVNTSQEMAAYFRENGVAAISLTAADRTDNPQEFKDNYEAWRTGKWREGSAGQLQNRPVPQMVFAVDIFKEGVDVPAINIVILLNDTNSHIEFIQSIGRGLRLAPFKTKLIILDAVGLYRKLPLLKYLVPEPKSDEKKKPGEKEEESEDKETGHGGFIFEGSTDVTKKLNAYLDDLPSRLILRYDLWLNIPADVLVNMLDPWLAIRTGFVPKEAINGQRTRRVEQFYAFMSQFAERLYQRQATAEEKNEFRNKFKPAFFESELDYHEPIPEWLKESRVVYFRIIELLNRGRGEDKQLPAEFLDDIFPEFSEAVKMKMQNRGANLRAVRARIFRTTIEGMEEELYKNVLKNPDVKAFEQIESNKSIDNDLKDRLKAFLTLIKSVMRPEVFKPSPADYEEARYHFADAEGSFDRTKEVRREDVSTRVQYNINDQHLIINLLLLHPRFKNLTAEDFELAPQEFQKKVEPLITTEKINNLLITLGEKEVLQKIITSSTDYLKSSSQRYGTITDRNNLMSYFENPTTRNLIAQDEESLRFIYNNVRLANDRLNLLNRLQAKDGKLLEALEEILKSVNLFGKLAVFRRIQDLSEQYLVSTQRKEHGYYRTALADLVSNSIYQEYLTAENMAKENSVNHLIEANNNIQQALRRLGDNADEFDKNLLRTMEDTLLKVGVVREIPIAEMSNVKFITTGSVKDLKVSIRSSHPGLPEASGTALQMTVQEDALRQPYLVFAQDFNNSVESFYESLRSDMDRTTFLNGFVSLIDDVANQVTGDLTILLPKNRENYSFFKDLFSYIKISTEYAFLGPFEIETPNRDLILEGPAGSQLNLNFKTRNLSSRRLPQLNPQTLSAMSEKLSGSHGYSFAERLFYILNTMYNTHQLKPVWKKISDKLSSASIRDRRISSYRDELLRAIVEDLDKDLIRGSRMSTLKAAFIILGGKSLDPLTAEQIKIAYFVSFFSYIWIKDEKDSISLRRFMNVLQRYYLTLNGVVIDLTLETRIDNAINIIRDNLTKDNQGRWNLKKLNDLQLRSLDEITNELDGITQAIESGKTPAQIMEERIAAREKAADAEQKSKQLAAQKKIRETQEAEIVMDEVRQRRLRRTAAREEAVARQLAAQGKMPTTQMPEEARIGEEGTEKEVESQDEERPTVNLSGLHRTEQSVTEGLTIADPYQAYRYEEPVESVGGIYVYDSPNYEQQKIVGFDAGYGMVMLDPKAHPNTMLASTGGQAVSDIIFRVRNKSSGEIQFGLAHVYPEKETPQQKRNLIRILQSTVNALQGDYEILEFIVKYNSDMFPIPNGITDQQYETRLSQQFNASNARFGIKLKFIARSEVDKETIIVGNNNIYVLNRGLVETIEWESAGRTGSSNKAMLSDVGGIDLNSANLSMVVKRDGRGVVLPVAQQDLAQLSRLVGDGLEPKILSIIPASRSAVFQQLVAH